MKKKISRMILVLFLIGCSSALILWQLGYFPPRATYDVQLNQSLKDASAVPIGVAVNSKQLEDDATYRSLILQHFNSIVAESQMKMKWVYPSADKFDWTPTDYLVNFSMANNIQLHGHTLLWHSSIPNWIQNFAGSDAEFEAMIKNYIQTVVSRYKGKIVSWDVVNEAFTSTGYRDTLFYQRLGPNYLKKAYEWAHEADPSAILYYNDYNLLSDQAKIDVIITEIRRLIGDEAVPIDGIGIRGHIKSTSPSLDSIATALQKWNGLGMKLRISEMDISLNWDGKNFYFSQKIADLQQARYHDVLSLILECPNLTGITVWGLSDKDSWIPGKYGHPDWPLLFDGEYNPKPAAQGFLDALQEANN